MVSESLTSRQNRQIGEKHADLVENVHTIGFDNIFITAIYSMYCYDSINIDILSRVNHYTKCLLGNFFN